MSEYFDAHVHTYLSDGIFSPEQICEKAIWDGLSVLVITDHNTCMSEDEISELRRKYPQLELPLGCEISCKYQTIEGRWVQLHLGAINFTLTDKMKRILAHNNKSVPLYVGTILERLESECGISLCSFEELKDMITANQPGRKHIANLLVERGYCSSNEESFQKYIGDNAPAYFENIPYFVTMEEVIKAVVDAGGVVSLCHLFKYELSNAETEALLSTFSQMAGDLGALEVYYFRYNEDQRKLLAEYARRFQLLPSAASDYHGDGESKGLMKCPKALYEKMREHMDRHAAEKQAQTDN